jgi:hypothetical protein
MILSIVDKHTLAPQGDAPDAIQVHYNPDSKTTTVDCSADLVTIGVAATVLDKMYRDALYRLPSDLVQDIQKSIKEATNGEIHRNESTQS